MPITSKSAFDFDDYDLLVGIDFGTTFSGCSFVYLADEKKTIYDIDKWPKAGYDIYPKTPTTLLYKPDGTLITWGKNSLKKLTDYEFKKEDVVYQSRFKLRLDRSVEMDELPNGFTTIKLITDYLQEFHKHVLNEVGKSDGIYSNPDRIRYCLTVPAIWDDEAKTLMREAAVRAGIVKADDHPLRLILTSEPEAAAIFCEKQVKNYDLKPGSRFMICDAGGGTVDLIVFEITENDDGTRSLREVTKGSGNTCGSTFIDQNMERLLRKKLSHYGTPTNKAIRAMVAQFIEEIKANFGGEHESNEFECLKLPSRLFTSSNISIPDYASEFGIQDNTIGFTYDELCEKVFDPVVKQTITLIAEQLKLAGQKKIDALFLVGGFGCSSYLYDSIDKEFRGQIGTLSQVPKGEKAIARGAVYFGLTPTLVSARVLRRTYGLVAKMKFDPNLDDEKDSYTDKNQKYRQKGFSVYVTKGGTIELGHHVLKDYTVVYPNDTDADIYAYDDDGAPPRTIKDPRVVRVSRFPIKMPHFPDVKKGELIYMSVKMYFDQTEIKIEVTIRDRIFTCTSKYESNEKGLMLKQDLRPSVSTPAPSFIPPPTQNYRGSASDSESDTESPKEKKPNTFEKTWKKIVRALE